jgi:dTDP-4-amino-4,6-dideoxygalactose transaminase
MSTAFIKASKRPLYHLPPTAVQISARDFSHAMGALISPSKSRENFKYSLVEKIGNPNCFFTSSGRAALTIILLTLKEYSKRKKVIIPAYTCPTVANAVFESGLQPIFCDVDENTLDMDRDELMGLLDEDILAIIPTHLYGLAQDITDLIRICREKEIFIIEDAAQAFGATFEGKMVGNRGDFGFFSMGRGKCIPTGNGGVIITKKRYVESLSKVIHERIPLKAKRDIASILRFLGYGVATTPTGWWLVARSPLNPAKQDMDPKSYQEPNKETFSATQAGIGFSILERIESIQDVRYHNSQLLIEILSGYDYLKLPKIPAGSKPVFLRMPIVVDTSKRANQLYESLSRAGIGVSRSYYRTLPDIFADHLSNAENEYKGATHLANCLLTLPTHQYMKEEDFHRMKEILDSQSWSDVNANTTTG